MVTEIMSALLDLLKKNVNLSNVISGNFLPLSFDKYNTIYTLEWKYDNGNCCLQVTVVSVLSLSLNRTIFQKNLCHHDVPSGYSIKTILISIGICHES